MKPAYLQYDNLDDRREVLYLLGQLPPRRRLTFLAWCCRAAVMLSGSAVRPSPSGKTVALAKRAERDSSADRGLSLDIYGDLWRLSAQYGLDIDRAVDRLVEMVRGKDARRGTLVVSR